MAEERILKTRLPAMVVAIALAGCATVDHSPVAGIRIIGDCKGWLYHQGRLERRFPQPPRNPIPPYELALVIYPPVARQPPNPFPIMLCIHLHEESSLISIVLDEARVNLKAGERIVPPRFLDHPRSFRGDERNPCWKLEFDVTLVQAGSDYPFELTLNGFSVQGRSVEVPRVEVHWEPQRTETCYGVSCLFWMH